MSVTGAPRDMTTAFHFRGWQGVGLRRGVGVGIVMEPRDNCIGLIEQCGRGQAMSWSHVLVCIGLIVQCGRGQAMWKVQYSE